MANMKIYDYEYGNTEDMVLDADGMGIAEHAWVPMADADREHLVATYNDVDEEDGTGQDYSQCTQWLVTRFIPAIEDGQPVYTIDYFPCATDHTSPDDEPFSSEYCDGTDGTVQFARTVAELTAGQWHTSD